MKLRPEQDVGKARILITFAEGDTKTSFYFTVNRPTVRAWCYDDKADDMTSAFKANFKNAEILFGPVEELFFGDEEIIRFDVDAASVPRWKWLSVVNAWWMTIAQNNGKPGPVRRMSHDRYVSIFCP